jgi:hypothetical protein
MHCHVGFLMMWRRESKERERGRCLAKQPPHERSNYLMRQLHNHCMSCCCHATHNILFLCTQIKELYRSTRRLTRQLFVHVVCWVDPRLRVNAWDNLSDRTNVLGALYHHPTLPKLPMEISMLHYASLYLLGPQLFPIWSSRLKRKLRKNCWSYITPLK